MRKDLLLASLPREWSDTELRTKIRQALETSKRKVVVLDDDPTGTQTVHSLPVLTEWTAEALSAAWDEAATCFYVLTNSRRYPMNEALTMNREIALNLAQVARACDVEPLVVSRSDSTLRGHYPGEVSVLAHTLEGQLGLTYDSIIIVPFFLEGGRYTAGDVHWVQVGQKLVPAAQTEYAQDPTFGYRHSDLKAWVAEKTRGQVAVNAVHSIGLETIREGGPGAVAALLTEAEKNQVVVVNAVSYRDLEVFVWGMMEAERHGKRFLCRTAASFVKVCSGIPDRGLLTTRELCSPTGAAHTGGLTLVGSHVQRTTEQVEAAQTLANIEAHEFRVDHILDRDACTFEIDRVRSLVEANLVHGRDMILYTSRELVVPPNMTQLEAAQQVSAALVKVLKELAVCPSYLIGKGGITSSDLATEALGVRKAQVLGQIIPGVPVWQLGRESKYPALPYVVFPGNVGDADGLADAIEILRRARLDQIT
jgi:uncharacterized protein YgbK (DUF1537 family)